MFDLEVINQDSFLDLPMEAKALYFLLGMNADDEGFVSPRKVLRLYGGTEDSIKILALKNFIIPFKTGVIVITDWNNNNWLDSRRLKPTIYQEEKQMLIYDEASKKYVVDTNAKQMLRENRIEENRIEENRVEESSIDNNQQELSALTPIQSDNSILSKKDLENEFEKLWSIYPNKKGKEQAKNKYILARKHGTTYEEIEQGLNNYINYCNVEKTDVKFIKHGSTWFNQKCWNDDYKVSNNSNKKVDNQMEILKGVYNGAIKIS